MIVGFAIATWLSSRWWVFALSWRSIEGARAFWIRDNMTLNVVMLIHPIPGLREWQAG